MDRSKIETKWEKQENSNNNMNRLKRTLKYAYINNDMNETPEKWTMDVFTFFLYNQKERFIYISLNTSISRFLLT